MHIPVLLKEIIDNLPCNSIKKGIDCTLGLGGHLKGILENTDQNCHFLAFDRDKNNLEHAKARLKDYQKRIIFVHNNFKNLVQYAGKFNFKKVDFILFDLGVSSPHLDTAEKGFSWKKEGPLDMRFDQSGPDKTAREIINTASEKKLTAIFSNLGEVPFAGKIARKIIEKRQTNPINTTTGLTEIIRNTVFGAIQAKAITLVFQALRIAVNDELTVLRETLPQAINLLNLHGRIAVISYHSLEDRIVKETFKYFSSDCHCDKKSPVCTCNFQPVIKVITRKAIIPSKSEILQNPRSRSAKLRIAEKIN